MPPSADGHSPDATHAPPGAVLIHPTALVDKRAELGREVEVGPNTIIGPDVVVGDHTRIGANCLIDGWTTIGPRCRIHHAAVVGGEPQDFKYRGERTYVRVGEGNIFREFVTIHRATGEGNETRIGDRNFFMAYVHVAHNCTIGNETVIANSANMGGHVRVDDCATIGGVTPIHQFVRIGRYSIIGGGSRIPMDIAPYVKVAGNPARVNGLNTIGLQRHGFSPETRLVLKQAYKLIFRSNLNVSQAIERLRSEVKPIPEVAHLIDFIEGSTRGITL
jgi:UDP-N-acetylglucosamine acyltransferase